MRLGIITSIATAIAIGAVIVSGGGGAGAAVWLSTTGNDSTCVRNDMTKPCATFQKAYQIATPGDLVSVAAGTYGSQEITKGSQSQSGPAIDFQCVSAHTCIIGGTLGLGHNGGGPSASDDAPSYLTFDGIDVSQGDIESHYYSSSNPVPNHITLENLHCWKTNSSLGSNGGPCLSVSGSNILFDHVEVGPVCCNSDGIQASGGRDLTTVFNTVTYNHLNVHDVYDTCSSMSAGLIATYGCTGSGIGDGCSPASCEHIDGIQAFGSDNFTVENSTFTAAGAQTLFFACVNSRFTNVTWDSNTLSVPGVTDEGGHPATIGQNCAGGYDGTINITNNDFEGGVYLGDNGQYKNTATLNVTGNTIKVVATLTQSGCTLSAFSSGSVTIHYSNTSDSAGCG